MKWVHRSPKFVVTATIVILAAVTVAALVTVGFLVAASYADSARRNVNPSAITTYPGYIDPAEFALCTSLNSPLRTFAVSAQTQSTVLYRDDLISISSPSQVAIPPPIDLATGNAPHFGSGPYAPFVYFFRSPVSIRGVDLENRTATLNFTITGVSGRGYDIPLTFPQGTTFELALFAGPKLLSPSGSYIVPLDSQVARGGFAEAAVQVPLAGSAAGYPADSYSFTIDEADIIVDLPDQPVATYDLDLDGVTLGSGSADGVTVLATPGHTYQFSNYDQCSTNVAFALLFRRSDNQTVLWILALMPLALIGLLGDAIWRNLRVLAEEKSNSPDSASNRLAVATFLESGLTLLAILPLRQVLVPDGLGGITRIDLVLGIEAALAVLFLVVGRMAALVGARQRTRDITSTSTATQGSAALPAN